MLGKKYYSYHKPNANFSGRFSNFYVVDEKEYRKKKSQSLIKREEEEEVKRRVKEVEEEIFKRSLWLDMNHEARIKLLGMPRATYFYKLKKFKEESKAELTELKAEELEGGDTGGLAV